jgi:hypothetical protein
VNLNLLKALFEINRKSDFTDFVRIFGDGRCKIVTLYSSRSRSPADPPKWEYSTKVLLLACGYRESLVRQIAREQDEDAAKRNP